MDRRLRLLLLQKQEASFCTSLASRQESIWCIFWLLALTGYCFLTAVNYQTSATAGGCCLESLKLQQQRNKFNFFTSSKERKMFTKFRIFGFSPSKSTLFVIKSLVNFSYPFQLHRAWCEKSFNSINGGLVRGRKYRCVIQDDKSISFFRLVRLKI